MINIKFPNDSGPLYQETIAGRLPIEPFNTFSILIFVLILIYFGKKVYQEPKKHSFFLFALPVIFLSWFGGTMYHATRSHEFWLVLDWLPITIVSLGGILYFIGKIKKKLLSRVLFFMSLFFFVISPKFIPFPEHYSHSIEYIVIAIALLIPFLWYAFLTRWKNVQYILFATVLFTLAITFRTLDTKVVLLPMGSHWLWHVFGGATVFCLLLYIYKDKEGSA